MRGLTVDEFHVLARTSGPDFFSLDAETIDAARSLQTRGLLGRCERTIFVTHLGRLAMQIYVLVEGMRDGR